MEPENRQPLMTLAEAARRLNVSYFRAAELARTGLLPVVRLGRQVRIHPERFEAWLDDGGAPVGNVRAFDSDWPRDAA